ncbi:uncharacterized protein CBL_05481 [Carabus blaptoides fortunei]
MRNIEIKAKVRNLADLLQKVKSLSDTSCEEISQHDTFYNVSQGRLKLRKFKDTSSELIFYERDDKEGPKLSSYEKVSLSPNATDQLDAVLTRALGCTGVVKKRRQLFMVDQTRIHIDSVQDLGDFIELEVTLKPNEEPEDGIQIAHSLMNKLGVDKNDLIAGAYRDLLENSRQQDI